ncbi:hypothetical protein M2158_009320 [Streptomyces sp. SAI-144]|nr:hypothetical protein [Streptomyces sp. SAI-144]
MRGPGCLARRRVLAGPCCQGHPGSRDRAGLSAGSHPPADATQGAIHPPEPRTAQHLAAHVGAFTLPASSAQTGIAQPVRYLRPRPCGLGARGEAGPGRFWGAGAAGCGRSLRGARWVQGRGPGAGRRGSSPRAQVWRGAGKPPGSGVGLRRGSRPEGVCVEPLRGARGGAPMGSGTQAWREAGRRFRGGAGRSPGGSTGADLEGRGGKPRDGSGRGPAGAQGVQPCGQ